MQLQNIFAAVRRGLARPSLCLVGAILVSTPNANGQSAVPSVRGMITSQEGQPISGATITVGGTSIRSTTDLAGRFTIQTLPPGTYLLVARALGYLSSEERVSVVAGGGATLTFRLERAAFLLDNIVVSGAREGMRRADTPANVGVIAGDDIREVRPSHPSEIMNRVSGVYVNVTGGEGHMTAIRQPVTTDPVYLYLEDGVPTRSTGFFNHNALYEINLPQADRVEVFKGPGTALYGSDAIGGIINVSTRAPSPSPSVSATVEAGENTWGRVLLSGSDTWGNNGVRAELNLTRTDGWRRGTDYDRQSATLRWDSQLSASNYLHTLVSFSNIDQQTAGTSAISRDDFENNPTINYTPISYREVRALRVSSAFEHRTDRTLTSLTPYVRYNEMNLLPNWSLTFDPALWETSNTSFGLMGKYRVDVEPLSARFVAGFDADLSPGDRVETVVTPTREGAIFTSYAFNNRVYDYDVRFQAFSPYLHSEFSPIPRVRLNAGLRLDMFSYKYTNHLGVETTGQHRRPADASRSFSHLSPKVGATADIMPSLGVFAAYRHGFRAPSEGQLFRQGQAENTVDLKPVKVNSFEVGFRGRIAERLSYEVSGYYMKKTDDILGFETPSGLSENVNAGETLHRGIEIGAGALIVDGLTLNAAYSYAKHTYEDWRPRTDVNLSGNEMESAPREIGNAGLTFKPSFLSGTSLSAEWVRLGSYWEDASNDNKYEGHDLLNLRANVNVLDVFTIYGRVVNATNTRYAERATFNAFRGEELAPGLPRTVYIGVEYR